MSISYEQFRQVMLEDDTVLAVSTVGKVMAYVSGIEFIPNDVSKEVISEMIFSLNASVVEFDKNNIVISEEIRKHIEHIQRRLAWINIYIIDGDEVKSSIERLVRDQFLFGRIHGNDWLFRLAYRLTMKDQPKVANVIPLA